MKRSVLRAAVVGAGVALAGMTFAPQASAYPVGPWGIEGPCKGVSQRDCTASPSADGLRWSTKGYSISYDKLGNVVCASDDVYCEPLMSLVRALPPLPVGAIV